MKTRTALGSVPRILLVEDDRINALDLSRRLPKLGYEVCAVVPTGEEAVRMAEELSPDLVLMDVVLGGRMDGIQAAEIIRERSNLPVVYLTADSNDITLSRAKLSHPSSYLLKPCKERELKIGIDMALLNHGLNEDLKAARDTLEQRVAERTAELGRVNDALRAEVAVRKHMEAQAREQADLLAKARDAIYVRDLAGTISYWNRSAERLYGIPAKEAMGRSALTLLGEDHEPDARNAEAETLRGGQWTGELRHVTGTGQELVVESRWTLVRDEAGAPKTILVVNTDITDRKRIAEQFLRTQRLESIGALASGIAHDLNNVFAPILMATDLITSTGDPENARIVEMVRSTARRGTEMVKQVLMFVRGGQSEMGPTDLSFLADEVRQLMHETLPCSIQVISETAKDVPMVLGDPTQLHQVLINLCVNARDAMPDGGELRIALDAVDVDEAKASENGGVKPGRYARVAVADTGTGMPPEVRKKIFEPFFTTKAAGVGTGLGLSTVVSIVSAHKGFIELDTEVGRGSRFLIHLPICELAAPEVKAPRKAAPGQGELIIIADDEHSIREITRLTLEVHNYRVLLARDGAEALAAYVQNRGNVALVITDIMMPIMNGRALVRALRNINPDLPILVFSAADRSNPLLGTLEEESVAFMRKPASADQLLEAVYGALHPGMIPGEPAEAGALAGTHFSI